MYPLPFCLRKFEFSPLCVFKCVYPYLSVWESTNSLSCRWLHTFLWLFYKYVGGGQHAINYSRHWVSPGSEADFIEQAWVLSQQMLQQTILFIILPLEVSTMTVNGKIIVFQSLYIRFNFHFLTWVWKMSVRVLRLRYALSYYGGSLKVNLSQAGSLYIKSFYMFYVWFWIRADL